MSKTKVVKYQLLNFASCNFFLQGKHTTFRHPSNKERNGETEVDVQAIEEAMAVTCMLGYTV